MASVAGILIVRDTLWISYHSVPGNFGYVTRNGFGQFTQDSMHIVPIKNSLEFANASAKNNGTHEIVEHNGDIYFLKERVALFRLRNGQLTAWPVSGYRNIFKAHGKLYVPAGDSLYVLENEELRSVAGWDTRSMGWVRVLLPMENGDLLIGSPNVLYRFDGEQLIPFLNLGEQMVNVQFWNGVVLPNRHFAVGSFGKGVFILHDDGEVCLKINKQHGLASNSINDLHYTAGGQLWLSTSNSLSMIDLTSPFTYFDISHGINNYIRNIIRVGNRLYTGSRGGFSYLTTDQLEPRFEPINYLPELIVLSFAKTTSGSFATTSNGVFQMFEDTIIQIVEDKSFVKMAQLNADTNLYLLKDIYSIELLERTEDNWIDHGRIAEFEGEAGILQDRYGNVWIPNFTGYGANRIWFDSLSSIRDQLLRGAFHVRHYPGPNRLTLLKGEIYIISDTTLLKFDPQSDEFLPSPLLAPVMGKSFTDFHRLQMGSNNDLWIYDKSRKITRYPAADSTDAISTSHTYWHAIAVDSGKYIWDNKHFRFLEPELQFLIEIYPEPDGITWFSGINGILVRYDPSVLQSRNTLARLMINEIWLPIQDSVLFSGNAFMFDSDFTLDPEMRDIRIRYHVVDHINADSVFYRYMLEGFDEGWSAWTHESIKDYTGLGPGKYTFHVQATDYFGEQVVEARFMITKKFPWYLRKVLIFVYILLAMGILYLGFKWRLHSLEKEKLRLQKMVKKRTQQLEERSRNLRQINEARSRFFSNISHEFRTPLTLILGHIQKLFRSDHSSNRGHLYRHLDRNARQLLHLVNQLLELARLESGRITSQPLPIRLYQECDRIVASYSSLAESRNILLSFEFEMDRELCVLIDGEKFKSILINLLSNAFKFSYSGGKVTLCVKLIRLVEKQVTFVCLVRDTGKGISEAHLSRIFDRFYQVEPNYTEKAFGTGIGLSIVKEYVKLLNGTLEVSSKPERGTEFTLTFTAPLARSSSQEETEPVYITEWTSEMEEESPEDSIKGVTILIVEDNPSMQEYIRDILAAEYNVALAADGRKGLDYAVVHLPDLIIADIMMPVMDGMQLLSELKNDLRTSHIPVIMLTALSDRENKFKGLKQGADDYLVKPFDEEELKILIRNRLNQRKKIRESWKLEDSLNGSNISSIDDKFLDLVQAMVEENLGNSHYGVNDLAADVGMSRSQLHRKLTTLTNYSASNFIKIMRLQRARLLIQANSGTIAEIAYEVGFSSPQYFSHCFHEYYGHSPGQLKSHIPPD